MLDKNGVAFRSPWIKEINLECRDFVVNSNPLYCSGLGYLHIPKTGGTSLMDFLHCIVSSLASMPVPLFHTWDIELLKAYFPSMKIAFLIRDPLHRIISGYGSRLRMGAPEYSVRWQTKEAAAFSLYPRVEDFLLGLTKSDEFNIGATTFLMNSIPTIAWGYSHYFKSVHNLQLSSSQIGIVAEVEEMKSFIYRLFDDQWIQPSPGINSDSLLGNYNISHRSKRNSSDILTCFSEGEIDQMRHRLRGEYLIYNELKKYT